MTYPPIERRVEMSENTSMYGRTGATVIVVAAVMWAVAVVLGESGSSPDVVTQSIGYLGLALLAVGMIALSAMLVGIYAEAES